MADLAGWKIEGVEDTATPAPPLSGSSGSLKGWKIEGLETPQAPAVESPARWTAPASPMLPGQSIERRYGNVNLQTEELTPEQIRNLQAPEQPQPFVGPRQGAYAPPIAGMPPAVPGLNAPSISHLGEGTPREQRVAQFGPAGTSRPPEEAWQSLMRVAATSPIPRIPVQDEDYDSYTRIPVPLGIGKFGSLPIKTSVLKTAFNTVTGQVTPENLAIVLGSEFGAGALKLAVNSERVATALKAAAPGVQKAADIIARGAIPGTFTGIQGYRTAEEAGKAYQASQEGNEPQAEAHTVAAATNLLLAIASGSSTVESVRRTAAQYPTAPSAAEQARAAEVGGIAEPSVPAGKAQALEAQGSRLAANVWKSLDRSQPLPIQVAGKQVFLQPPQMGSGNRMYHSILDADGNLVAGGTSETVQSWLRQHSAEVDLRQPYATPPQMTQGAPELPGVVSQNVRHVAAPEAGDMYHVGDRVYRIDKTGGGNIRWQAMTPGGLVSGQTPAADFQANVILQGRYLGAVQPQQLNREQRRATVQPPETGAQPAQVGAPEELERPLGDLTPTPEMEQLERTIREGEQQAIRERAPAEEPVTPPPAQEEAPAPPEEPAEPAAAPANWEEALKMAQPIEQPAQRAPTEVQGWKIEPAEEPVSPAVEPRAEPAQAESPAEPYPEQWRAAPISIGRSGPAAAPEPAGEPVPRPIEIPAEEAKLEANAERIQQGRAGEVEALPGTRQPGVRPATGERTGVRAPGQEQPYEAQYAVRELADTYPSHNPFSFETNPEYHHINDRDYSDQQAQARVIHNSLPAFFDPAYLITDNPDATNGPSIIDASGNVLGGNNRRMTLERVYRLNPKGAQAYRDMLVRKAANFGIDPKQVAAMKQPILVRQLTDQAVSPQRAITDFNKPPTAALNTAEKALADARSITPETAKYISSILESAGPQASLNDVMSGKHGPTLVNRLIREGIFTEEERPALLDSKTGAVTKLAKERVGKMLLGNLFQSSDHMARVQPSLRNKLERIAPLLKQVEGNPEWDITPDIRQATSIIEYDAEFKKAYPDRTPVKAERPEYAGQRQAGMFGEPEEMQPRPQASDKAERLAEVLRENSGTAVAKAMRGYVEKSAEQSMFAAPDPAEEFQNAFGESGPVPVPAGKFGSERGSLSFKPKKSEVKELWTKPIIEKGGTVKDFAAAADKLTKAVYGTLRPDAPEAARFKRGVELGLAELDLAMKGENIGDWYEGPVDDARRILVQEFPELKKLDNYRLFKAVLAAMSNRHMGTMLNALGTTLATPRNESERALIERILKAIAAARNLETAQVQAIRWGKEHELYTLNGIGAEAQDYAGGARAAVDRARLRDSGAVGATQVRAPGNADVRGARLGVKAGEGKPREELKQPGPFGSERGSIKIKISKKAIQARATGRLAEQNKRYGETLRSWYTARRDTWAARVNQELSRLRKLVPDPIDQEGIAILRDFKHKPGELKQWLAGTHAGYAEVRDIPIARENIEKLRKPIERALNPTPAMLQADQALTRIAEQSLAEGQRLGFIDKHLKPEEYVTHLLFPEGEEEKQPGLGERAGRAMGYAIGRNFPYNQPRSFPTLLEAAANNFQPRTLNAFQAFQTYADKFATARATHLLINQLQESHVGVWGTKGGKGIPKGWVEIAPHAHPFRNLVAYADAAGEPQAAYQTLFVPPTVEAALRPITDPDYTAKIAGFRNLRVWQSYTKAAQLGFSFFHAISENYMALANMGARGYLKGLRAERDSPEFLRQEIDFIGHGGTTSIQGKVYEALQSIGSSQLPSAGEAWRTLPGVRHADQIAHKITELTFSKLQRQFKVVDYAIHKAAWLAEHPNASLEAQDEAMRSIAKEVNSVYGGLHWENLGINKSTLEAARAIILAPDWTFSNIFNLSYTTERGTPAGKMARMFWLRAIVGGMIATQLMSMMLSHKPSKRPTQVYMGTDKDGAEIYQNVFFKGAPGDVANLLYNMKEYGPIEGLVKTLANKISPALRTLDELRINKNFFGRDIVPKGMNPVAATARSTWETAKGMAPIPWSLGNMKEMLFGPEHAKYKIPLEVLTTLFAGTPPQHVSTKPPKEPTNSILDQIMTGKITTPKARGPASESEKLKREQKRLLK